MNWIRTAVLVTLAASASGCFKHVYESPDLTAKATAEFKSTNVYLFWGLLPISSKQSLGSCGSRGVAKVKNNYNAWSFLATAVTGGILTVSRSKMYCGNGERVVIYQDHPDSMMAAPTPRPAPQPETVASEGGEQ